MTVEHLSLWLHPTAHAVRPLDAVIAELAAVDGTPVRPAHVTLVGGFDARPAEVARAAAVLAAETAPLEVVLTALACELPVHRSVFLRAEASPDFAAAVDRAAALLDLPRQPPADPHLSLAYSERDPAGKRELAAHVTLDLPRRLRLTRLSLWNTEMSDISCWRQLGEWPLTPTVCLPGADAGSPNQSGLPR